MAESSTALGEYLRKISVDLDGDILRERVRSATLLVIVGEGAEQTGAAK